MLWHETSGQSGDTSFNALTAAHTAKALAEEQRGPKKNKRGVGLEVDYLKALGLEDRLPAWRQAAEDAWDEVQDESLSLNHEAPETPETAG